MFRLMKNEFIKIFGRKSSWIMFILMIIAMGGMAFIMIKSSNSMQNMTNENKIKYNGGITAYQVKDGSILSQEEFWGSEFSEEDDYKEISLTVPESIKLIEKNIKKYEANPKSYDKNMIADAKKERAYYQAYNKEDTLPFDDSLGINSADFFSSFGQLYVFPTLFSVIIASMIIAAEFTGGTIKLLLIRPFSRTQILLSKYFTTLIYGLLMSLVMVISAFLFSFSLPHQPLSLPISPQQGIKTGIDVAIQLFASNYLLLILYVTLAFFFSAVIRSQAIAVGVGLGVLFSGSILGSVLPMLIEKYSWAKWIIFNLLNLNTQVIGMGYVTDSTLSIPATIVDIMIHIIIILSATIFIFNKRDVALS